MCTELRIIELVAARYGPCEIGDLQDRMKRAVALLGPEEVKNIMREEGKIEVILQGLHSNSSAGSPKPALPWSAGLRDAACRRAAMHALCAFGFRP